MFNASVAPTTNRTDIAGIFIPDLIKVDLSTAPARLAGGGATDPVNPDDAGFSRLSIFGGDVLTSQVQAGFGGGVVPGGWPNGRRFGDDVVDIAVTALISDLRVSPPIIRGPAGDNVDKNDIAYNKVFPYAATPLNGRNCATKAIWSSAWPPSGARQLQRDRKAMMFFTMELRRVVPHRRSLVLLLTARRDHGQAASSRGGEDMELRLDGK